MGEQDRTMAAAVDMDPAVFNALLAVERAARDLRECERGCPPKGINHGDARPRLDAALREVDRLRALAADAARARVSVENPADGIPALLARINASGRLGPGPELYRLTGDLHAVFAAHAAGGDGDPGALDMLLALTQVQAASSVVIEALLRGAGGAAVARDDLLWRYMVHRAAQGASDAAIDWECERLGPWAVAALAARR